MSRVSPNAALVGQPGSRAHLQTPCLVLDLPALQHNIEQMAGFARTHAIALRPHAKTHKSVQIARRQRQAGAIGICTATIGEAEVLADGGIDELLITSPAIGEAKISRLIALAGRSAGTLIVVDAMDNLRDLALAADRSGCALTIVVALDIGNQRIGARDAGQALALCQAVVASESLHFGGLHAYAGSLQHTVSLATRTRQADEARSRVVSLLAALKASGLTVPRVSGAGTGSAELDAASGVFTEMQVGSYVFMDVEYDAIETRETPLLRNSLFVATRVMSANHGGFVTTDAGTKRFSMGGPAPRVHRGAPTGCSYGFQGDEHGKLILPTGAAQPAPGHLIELIVPHCDPTVDKHDHYHVIDGETLVDIWPIEGRGVF